MTSKLTTAVLASAIALSGCITESPRAKKEASDTTKTKQDTTITSQRSIREHLEHNLKSAYNESPKVLKNVYETSVHEAYPNSDATHNLASSYGSN